MERILLLGLLISFSGLSMAQIVSFQSGDWNETSTWDGGVVPDDDEAEILASHTVTLTADVSCIGIFINSGGTLDIAGNTLTLEEYIENDGGTVLAETSTIEFINSVRTMEVVGSFSVGTLSFENTRSTGKITISGAIVVLDSLVLVDGQFFPNNNIILQATASKTARLAEVNFNAQITGDIIYQVYAENGNDNMQWRYFSFPGSGFTVDKYQILGNYVTGSVVTNPSTSLSQADPDYESIRLYTESSQTYETIPSQAFTVGTGYACYSYNTNEATVFSYTLTPVTGDQSLPITYTSSGSPEDDGWNLVGNPFMSPIDWDNVTVANIENAIYYNDNASGTTISRTYNGGTGNPIGVTSNIATSQAFWVHATAASPSVTVYESSKVNISTTTLYKKQPVKNIIRVKILASDGTSDQTVIRFKDDATNDYDASYDAYQRRQGYVTVSTHYKASELDADKMTLAINTLTFDEYDTIPLVLENLSAGDYNLSFIENTVSDEVTLINLDTEEEFNINDISNYVIKVGAGEDVITDRFALITKTRTDVNYKEDEDQATESSVASLESKNSLISLAVYPNPALGEQVTLSYAHLTAGNVTIQLVDMMGKVLFVENVQVSTSGQYVLPLTDFPNGVYSLIVLQDDQQVSEKVIINRK
jgi:hypothetical protein